LIDFLNTANRVFAVCFKKYWQPVGFTRGAGLYGAFIERGQRNLKCFFGSRDLPNIFCNVYLVSVGCQLLTSDRWQGQNLGWKISYHVEWFGCL